MTGGGGPIEGAYVTLQIWNDQFDFWNYYGSAPTDENGLYAISGVETGTYGVKFEGPWEGPFATEYWENKPTEATAQSFPVSGNLTRSAELAVGATIAGSVTGPGGPRANSTVSLYYGSETNPAAYAYAGDDGAYVSPALPAGTWKAKFDDGDFTLMTEWWDNKPDAAAATPIPLTAGQHRTGINALLSAGATISGTVTVAGGAVGVAGANVTLYEITGGDALWTDSASTAGNGAFSFTGLAPGTYTLETQAPSGSAMLSEYWDSKYVSDPLDADAFALASDATLTRNVALLATATVSGTVTDTAGDPVSGATVTLTPTEGTTGNPRSVTTSATGDYSLTQVRPGDYLLRVKHTGDPTQVPISVASGVDQDRDFVLPAGATVTGTVTRPGGAPVAGATVEVWSPSGQVATGVTASNGTYRIKGLAAGSYTLRFAPADLDTVFAGGATRLAAATFFTLAADATKTVNQAYTGVTVNGTVTAGGTALTGQTVTLIDKNDGAVRSLTTPAGGAYSFTGVAPGTYTLHVAAGSSVDYLEWWLGGGTESATAKTLAVSAANVTQPIALVTGGKITGSVKLPNGTATDDVYVTAYTWAANGSVGFTQSRMPAADGTFAFSGLIAGEYTLQFDPTDSTYPDFWLGGATTAASATHVSAANGATTATGMTTFLPRPTGGISGTIAAAGVSNWSGVFVTAQNTSTFRTRSGVVTSGSYAIQNLPAGTYKVQVTGVPGFADGWFDDDETLGAAATITVAAATVTGKNITLLPNNATLTGTVTGGGGPVADATVMLSRIYGDGSSRYVTSVDTGAGGTYAFTNRLRAGGNYRVDVDTFDESFVPQSVTLTAVAGTQTKNISLVQAGALHGKLTERGTSTPIPDMDVFVYKTTSSFPTEVGVTLEDGTYSVGGLAPGTYSIRFGAHGFDGPAGGDSYYAPEWLGGQVVRAEATTFTVTAGGDVAVAAGQLGRAGVISGNISGVPEAGTTVWLDDALLRLYTTAGVEVASGFATDGELGRYSVPVKPGTYKICVGNDSYKGTPLAGGCRITSTTLAGTPAGGSALTVAAGADLKDTDLRLGVAPPPALTSKTPTISGTPVVGATLTAKPGAWTPGTAFTYQWYANGTAITAAKASTLKLAAAQKGKQITVKVTGKKSGFTSVAKTSAKTLKVAVVATPTISGTAKVGKTLTAKPGTWTAKTTFTYQWYASGKAISKATKSTFKLTSAQKGKTITVKVTGKLSGYPTVSKTSKATAKVG
ncbi:hypothetical protein Microterr_05200 [Microbacterium terricola]|uniref:alpha-amylase n=1 Tax=Microbacterium terricola TaxID=344163 RepID=A0ABM8DWH8_9MICO|nr:hypothetical protein Microterr_05200 [Microbacterium terricola]